jgi:predicted permease
MDALLQDLRYAFRRLTRSPGFTVVAALSLALGIGANTAIFSMVNGVMLKGLPVRDVSSLVEIYFSEENGYPYATSSYPDFEALRDGLTDVFEGVTAWNLIIARMDRGEEAEVVLGETVSGNYFDLLGVKPTLGRGFLPEEDETPGAAFVTVLSHGYWERALGADPNILGKTVRVNRRPYTVVGVAPRGFHGMMRGLVPDFWVPMMMSSVIMGDSGERLQRRGSRNLFVKGRLRPGVTVEQAGAALATLSANLVREFPETNQGRSFSILPTKDVAIHPFVDRMLLPVAALLLSVVGLVLLIACVNLASFLLARAADRRKEIALRLAMGARRWNLVRQLLTETVLLALIGGGGGVLLAHWTLNLLLSLKPPLPVPVNLDIGIDGTVLAFTSLVSLVAGVLFGLVPALQATNPDVAPVLKDEGATTQGQRRLNLRNALVVTQVAVSLVLLVGAGLFVRSLQKAQSIDPGFNTRDAVLLLPNLQLSGFSEDEGKQIYMVIEERLAALPGVTAVGMVSRLPLGASVETMGVTIQGVQPPPGRDEIEVDNTSVTAGYFQAMGIPILRGRNFGPEDGPGSPRVIIVSEAAASRFWPGKDPVGETVTVGEGSVATVIGVAADTKVRTLGEAPRPFLYDHARRGYNEALTILVKGDRRSSDLLPAVRRTAMEVAPNLVILESKTMEEHTALLLFAPRMAALLLSVFGALALVLAGVGLYGLVSYAVARRTREVGIRISLGADTTQVIGMVMGGGMRLVLIGGGIGMALSASVTWLISGYLYGIGALDLVTFFGIPLLLGAVALAAAYVPARRASRVDPVEALRTE